MKHIVFFGPLRETAFCTGMSSMLKNLPFRQAMKQGYWILNPIEVKSVYYFLFEANVKLVGRNMKLHKVSHERTLSQSMSTLSCIPFVFMTIDMSSSSRIEKLPSSYSSESAGWKVLH